MKIARVTSQKQGETDRLLSALVARLQAKGVALAGIVKDLSHESSFENGCDMKVQVLPKGPVIQITQNLGAGSDACRLDPSAIAEAVTRVEGGTLEGAALFILNKFGPEEVAGRGFVSAIGRAVQLGIPVLVGVSGASCASFDAFAGGLAEELPDDPNALDAWCRAAITLA
ncbi:DUF2478 domain-containing protein [Aliiroseovarius lamellibrachiae]|uniref:DUF2478 domain-containing protein n=1 Tax=Aliiroseovarius lamellibrachiae TaxID=1924933 RepID=UPI001FEA8993|nr:DUF2478 domain-containing protein [Aliiroseovarius lamellibrachiae]